MYCSAPSATISNRLLPSWAATGASSIWLNRVAASGEGGVGACSFGDCVAGGEVPGFGFPRLAVPERKATSTSCAAL
jgi:hypothetical protein